ncbi:MAG: CRISPR-associated endonuclease Cas6 [Bacteroidota bacterium]|nr:CRISPR-associated endonuclease Cas6 [Bacteroidota bacterium]
MQLRTTTIQFPEISLKTRDAHKLRGYFGNLFKEHSELLHNHYADGSAKYKYPLVQYKVINKIPHLVGVEEGGKLLMDLFLKIQNINIQGVDYEINSKNITNKITEIGDFTELNEYKFETLWMGLNQNNHKKYQELKTQEDKNTFLNKQIQNNILAFYKGVEFYTKDRIMASSKLIEKTTKFKDKNMLAFSGHFVTNAILPNLIGIGKSVSRGFGSIQKS